MNGRALVRKEPECVFPEHLAVEKDYGYIRNLGRFAGGQTKGTIHGGATLEEILVPVITLTLDANTSTAQPPTLCHAPLEATLSPLGEATLELTLSRPASDILLEQDGRLFQPDEMRGTVAVFRMRGLSSGKTMFSLYAEQCRLGMFSVQMLAGLDLNNMGI